ncbi:hypothetical protein NQ011_10900 [Corynebacterium phoceense]|uniref:hypothetical protein n=1 Tax=Corynebacterium phoceense TaxID=1686286 RepID=UPI00211C1FD1|nr:hypothetical protein [Corynebacterium phoceense]MCQ9337182.1 hypothetical protein [Corynebacterium phoceense]
MTTIDYADSYDATTAAQKLLASHDLAADIIGKLNAGEISIILQALNATEDEAQDILDMWVDADPDAQKVETAARVTYYGERDVEETKIATITYH